MRPLEVSRQKVPVKYILFSQPGITRERRERFLHTLLIRRGMMQECAFSHFQREISIYPTISQITKLRIRKSVFASCTLFPPSKLHECYKVDRKHGHQISSAAREARIKLWPYFFLRLLFISAAAEAIAELDVGPILLTRPNPTNKWSDLTRPDPELTWNSGPDPARPIYAPLIVLPSATESFNMSTKWLFNSDANIIVSRATAFSPK